MIEHNFLRGVRGRDFTFKWNGHHYQDQLMEGVKKISQNETTAIFFNDFSFCALARLYKTILRKQ